MATAATAFLAVKAVQLAVVYFTPSQFDTSSQIIVDTYTQARSQLLNEWHLPNAAASILDKLIAWDAVYFNHLYVDDIDFEHEYVFCPLWWRLIKWIPLGQGNYYKKALVSIIVSNLCHWASIVMAIELTKVYFPASVLAKRPSLPQTVGKLYAILPAGIFLTVGYSENLANLLSLTMLWLHQTSIGPDYRTKAKLAIISPLKYLLSGVVLAVAVGVRANMILAGVFYLFDLYQLGYLSRQLKTIALIIVTGAIPLLSMIGLNAVAYAAFCPQRGAWCQWPVPSLFQYAQSHYWNVGFLKYWTPNNIPNFAFAAPTVAIHALAIKEFVSKLPVMPRFVSLIAFTAMTVAGAVFFWNTQIITRMVWVTPLAVWYLALQLTSPETTTPSRWTRIYIGYALVWIPLQSALFAAFLPPA
ncbi:hypothetical protein DIURU_003249 [Diutina rugosa]|uniref:GPI mannosyltransferase 2 n=1 Tax=Diutina rugosa TaxID=5481 RepID=A0A642UM56_DIURU|nr:uncharacterized protein DIURU_003249 [Diutina rugosa]KAA8901540.1 hypothetical protein DIURU_003249 [Diutina rugosa]